MIIFFVRIKNNRTRTIVSRQLELDEFWTHVKKILYTVPFYYSYDSSVFIQQCANAIGTRGFRIKYHTYIRFFDHLNGTQICNQNYTNNTNIRRQIRKSKNITPAFRSVTDTMVYTPWFSLFNRNRIISAMTGRLGRVCALLWKTIVQRYRRKIDEIIVD